VAALFGRDGNPVDEAETDRRLPRDPVLVKPNASLAYWFVSMPACLALPSAKPLYSGLLFAQRTGKQETGWIQRQWMLLRQDSPTFFRLWLKSWMLVSLRSETHRLRFTMK
jgi:hypothetical protein